ncbi:MAG: HNH endonuclease signature motif containing protein [Rugosibacter sp.]|nr:HNH endonuclease signature motif containing protein [Rugosibacter sp.]
MSSLLLSRLSGEDRQQLIQHLYLAQKRSCFICEQPIDLVAQKNAIDIDHVVPLKVGGKDDPANFALTHASCNRSKQASNLEVARILSRFSQLKEKLAARNLSPNLGDLLTQAGGGNHSLGFSLIGDTLSYSFSELGDNTVRTLPIYVDELSGFRFFFAKLPIQYLAHDAHINPRSIGSNISKLVEEFFNKRPQLHVPLGWISSKDNRSAIHVFDGQHKAAAQIMLGAKSLPVRVFIDPDPDTLITTNTNAGTTLKQVAFDKSVQRHLGNTLYQERLQRYRIATGRKDDDLNFSERDLINHFKGQAREIKRYILDSVRTGVTSDPGNKLISFIDMSGRGTDHPLSYSTVEKTFYSFFIYQEVLETPIDYQMEEGENPREVERSQIVALMNLIAESLYIDKFDDSVGTDKIENKLRKGETFSHDHLRAYRLSKEEIVYNWLQYMSQIARQYFIMQGNPDPQDKLFQCRFPEPVWENMRRFLKSLGELPVWVNTELSESVFGGKQNNNFWKTIFETGKTPQGMQVLVKPINLIDMIK